jgi:BlaI family transcriptional regulator, penicillinase repressor
MKISGNSSRRESQILDLVYSHGSVTASQLESLLPGGPSNSAVRWHLRTLETKGLLSHREDSGVFVYEPTQPKENVAKGELARLLSSFFGGSVTSVLTMLLDQERERLTEEDLEEMRRMIDQTEGERK